MFKNFYRPRPSASSLPPLSRGHDGAENVNLLTTWSFLRPGPILKPPGGPTFSRLTSIHSGVVQKGVVINNKRPSSCSGNLKVWGVLGEQADYTTVTGTRDQGSKGLWTLAEKNQPKGEEHLHLLIPARRTELAAARYRWCVRPNTSNKRLLPLPWA